MASTAFEVAAQVAEIEASTVTGDRWGRFGNDLTAAAIAAEDGTISEHFLTGIAAGGNLGDEGIAFDFGFAVPGDATIDGVTVNFWNMSSINGGREVHFVALYLTSNGGPTKLGANQGPSPATGSTAPGIDFAIGGAADLWGATLTPAIVNATGFGVIFQPQTLDDSTTRLQIDMIEMQVHYTESSSGQTVELDQATRSSAAQAVTWHRALTLDQATRTSAAQSVAPGRVLALDQAETTRTAQPLGLTKGRVLDQAARASTPQPLTGQKTLAVSQATRTSAAQSVTPAKSATLDQAETTRAAQPFSLSKLRALDQATRTSAGFAIGGAKAREIDQATRASEAQPVDISTAKVIDLATRTSAAQPITAGKRVTLQQATRTSEALEVRTGIVVTLDQATRTSAAASVARAIGLRQATRTSEARVVSPSLQSGKIPLLTTARHALLDVGNLAAVGLQ